MFRALAKANVNAQFENRIRARWATAASPGAYFGERDRSFRSIVTERLGAT
jgi:hypothetical protein